MKELAGRLVVPGAPGLAGVDADECPLVADEQNDVGKVRIDPKVLIIVAAGRPAEAGPGQLAPTGGAGKQRQKVFHN